MDQPGPKFDKKNKKKTILSRTTRYYIKISNVGRLKLRGTYRTLYTRTVPSSRTFLDRI